MTDCPTSDATITLAAGDGIGSIGSFTTDQGTNETLTIGVDGVLQDLDALGAPTADGQMIEVIVKNRNDVVD